MDMALRIFIILACLLIFVSVVYMLTRRRLNEPNSLLWLFIAFVTLVFGIFPGMAAWAADLLGIYYPPALVFVVAIIVLLLILFRATTQISKMQAQINELASTVAILREELNELGRKDEDFNSRG